jgi:hypothetical protein
MIEITLSIVAWVSVVLVQAIVHYVVLGSRRGRVSILHEEDLVLEESLSLATNDTAEDSDSSFTVSDCGYQGSMMPSAPGTPTLLGEKDLVDGHAIVEFMELLTQTGKELLKVS